VQRGGVTDWRAASWAVGDDGRDYIHRNPVTYGSNVCREDTRMDVVYSSFMVFECEADSDCAADEVCEYEDYLCTATSPVPAAAGLR